MDPCPVGMTPGLAEADNTLCECVDIAYVAQYYPSWATDELIDAAQRNQLSGGTDGPDGPHDEPTIPDGCEFENNAFMCVGERSYWNPYACACLYDREVCYAPADPEDATTATTGCPEGQEFHPRSFNGEASCICEPRDVIYSDLFATNPSISFEEMT